MYACELCRDLLHWLVGSLMRNGSDDKPCLHAWKFIMQKFDRGVECEHLTCIRDRK